MKWWRRAGEQGNAVAQFNLGVSYKTGWGVPRDYLSAHMWLNLAAEAGYETAPKIRDSTAIKMTPDQIAEAQRMAREWTAKHPQ